LPPAFAGVQSDLTDILRAGAREVAGEAGKVKRDVFQRMIVYAQNHQTTIPGRLLGCPPNERAAAATQLLQDEGLTVENLRGFSSCNITKGDNDIETCTVGVDFASPKTGGKVTMEVELAKPGMFGTWKITRLSNLKDLF